MNLRLPPSSHEELVVFSAVLPKGVLGADVCVFLEDLENLHALGPLSGPTTQIHQVLPVVLPAMDRQVTSPSQVADALVNHSRQVLFEPGHVSLSHETRRLRL